MSWKADYSPPLTAPTPRWFLLRQVIGLAELVLSILCFLALISDSRGEQWIGISGHWTATFLNFTLGHYAAYVVPSMLAITSWGLMFSRETVMHQYRSMIRGFGGLVLLIAACALITLHLAIETDDAALVFRGGGLIGSFLIAPEGLNMTQYCGTTGSFFILYGSALAGLVLFTESLVREAGRRAIEGVIALIVPQSWMRPIGLLFAPFTWIGGLMRPSQRFTERAAASDPAPARNGGRGRVFAPQIYKIETVAPASSVASMSLAKAPSPDLMPEPLLDPYAAPERPSRRALDPPPIYIETPNSYAVPEPEPWAEEAISVEFEAAREAEAGYIEPAVYAKRNLQRQRKPAAAPAPAPTFAPKAPIPAAAAARTQPEFDFAPRPFVLPKLELLAAPPPAVYHMSPEEAQEISAKIEQTLAQFKIDVQVIEVVQGPTVTRFAMHIAPGIRVSKILALENDLALALKAQQVRVLAPIPGQAAVGIEVPNKVTNPVVLRELLESEAFKRSKSPLSFALGKNIAGEPVIADLAQMPHLLIAGATGAGKSVCLNTIIASMLFRNPPDMVKFIMIDPKRVELSIYQAIPHLLSPVVCEPRKASAALAWTVEQMEARYKQLAEIGVRNIDGYNAVVNDRQPNKKAMGRELKLMTHIVVVIDELADLMMVAKNEVEEYIIRLAQMARAVGIHLILATQRPSVNVITGIIKANFPSRIAFRVSSKVDSRTILDMNGAQSLLGRGDMLYSPGGVKPFRLQGAFVADEEIERLADYIRAQEKVRYEKEDFEPKPTPAQRAKSQLMTSALGTLGQNPPPPPSVDDDEGMEPEIRLHVPTAGRAGSVPLLPADMESLTDEDLFDVALRLVLESRKASVSYIQRRLKIGYARAGRLMDMMEERGIVGPYQGSKPRDIIVDPGTYLGEEENDD